MNGSFRTVELSDPRFERDGLRLVTVKSPSLRRRADLTVWIPDGPTSDRNVPLVILLHGVYSSHWGWAWKGGAHRIASALIAAGEIPPMVLAMPSDGLWGDGSGYVPHDEADYERWIIDEVPAAALQAAPCLASAPPIFLSGLSMGGFGALRIGAKYRRACAGMSGHSSVTRIRDLDDFVIESRGEWSREDDDESVLAAMTGGRGPLPPFRFDCGTEDPLLSANRKLHRDLDAAGIRHQYEEFPGGHTWPYWEAHLADSLRFFAMVLADRQSRSKVDTGRRKPVE